MAVKMPEMSSEMTGKRSPKSENKVSKIGNRA